MKSLFIKSIIFVIPFILIAALYAVVLPIDFFAFRSWESLSRGGYAHANMAGVGFFYRNQHLVKYDHGDRLGFSDPEPKLVEWYTDKYGFRNRPQNPESDSYDIVLIGDSNIVGSHLDQKDIISEVLAQKCKCSTYSYGPRAKNIFFDDPRFKNNSPRLIIMEARSGEFFQPSVYKPNYETRYNKEFYSKGSNYPDWLIITIDRLKKAHWIQYLRARLHAPRIKRASASGSSSYLSLDARVDYMVNTVLKLQMRAFDRGSDFIFFLMPTRDRTLDKAVVRLRQARVKVIAYLPNEQYKYGLDLQAYYHEKDSHWREETVVKTADEILALSEDFKTTVMTK